jgi:hypothetical protein
VASFYTAPWIPEKTLREGAGGLTQQQVVQGLLRDSQDDLWLQEDIVWAIKRTNDTHFDGLQLEKSQRKVATAVVKELLEILIGADNVDRGRTGGMMGGTRPGRYRYLTEPGAKSPGTMGAASAGEPETTARGQTMTGRVTNNNGNRYQVLPFRVRVIADAGNYLELVRQLTGSRSFITVENVQYDIIPEKEEAYRGARMMRPNMADRTEVYGVRPLAVVTVWAESLVFAIPGARPTTPVKAEAAAKP